MTLLKVFALSIFLIAFAEDASVKIIQKTVNSGIQCKCGAFKSKDIKSDDLPLMTQNPLNTTCDDVGVTACQSMCISIVELGKERAPQVLCKHLGNIEDLKPSLFSRVCDRKWIYGGMTADNYICCDQGEVVPCTPRA